MNIKSTAIDGVKLITPTVYQDHRGFFAQTYQLAQYQKLLGENEPFVQDNYSRSNKGVLRGMHFQAQRPQAKLVRCTRGAIFDVVVDLRTDSATFKHWFGIELTEHNRLQLWVPKGLAHGFLALDDINDVEYKCSDYYHPQSEQTLRWDDPTIAIEWPQAEVILSDKDRDGLSWQQLFL
ncbi:dTDP-4-dehydrorhamnose 3,5-epimerase [Shewanella intestini]|uniref:dTDP-4-dehydrorhamnose 3,5-epimerase n=1 Tax=Shewanella intestini TaxID=2017544 RepID=A0ABS5HZT5_9GAMM|nr:dTDP-4-dehydrorhamnose 3,5-epimerase [Shewanella intestini]MRG35658.1 dTDP-4-dehydrorhamnose 3,5-epimerase [Shewanella sp. XMDDZSB0408]